MFILVGGLPHPRLTLKNASEDHLTVNNYIWLMAFPISIGDFIALVDKAHKLYVNVYKVAKTAPEELRGLDKELGSLSQAISLLVEEIKNPQSLVNQAGPDRLRMVEDLKEHTNETSHNSSTLPRNMSRRDRHCGSSARSSVGGIALCSPKMRVYRWTTRQTRLPLLCNAAASHGSWKLLAGTNAK